MTLIFKCGNSEQSHLYRSLRQSERGPAPLLILLRKTTNSAIPTLNDFQFFYWLKFLKRSVPQDLNKFYLPTYIEPQEHRFKKMVVSQISRKRKLHFFYSVSYAFRNTNIRNKLDITKWLQLCWPRLQITFWVMFHTKGGIIYVYLALDNSAVTVCFDIDFGFRNNLHLAACGPLFCNVKWCLVTK